jgi:hypothetical protein
VLAESSAALDHDKAQYMLFAGKKRPAAGWPAGEYIAPTTVTRGGTPVIDRTERMTIP